MYLSLAFVHGGTTLNDLILFFKHFNFSCRYPIRALIRDLIPDPVRDPIWFDPGFVGAEKGMIVR